MAESRFERWSRKKSEASHKSETVAPATPVAEPSPEQQELAVNEALTEQEVLEKYGLPNPDAIELGTDITGFMKKEIPELLRRRALRSLWRSNPVLAVLDGLNDYDEDYTGVGAGGGAVKTLYKVGQGMFDKAAKRAAQAEEQAGALEATEPDPIADSAVIDQDSPATPTRSLPDVRPPELGVRTAEVMNPEVAQVQAQEQPREPEPEQGPRHRPRMRFEH